MNAPGWREGESVCEQSLGKRLAALGSAWQRWAATQLACEATLNPPIHGRPEVGGCGREDSLRQPTQRPGVAKPLPGDSRYPMRV